MKVSVKIPKVGLTVDEVEFREWSLKVGDLVQHGQTLAIVESDKTSFDVPAPVDGKVVETFVDPGQMVSVGDVICVLEK